MNLSDMAVRVLRPAPHEEPWLRSVLDDAEPADLGDPDADDALAKAILAGGPSMGGLSPDELAWDAREARADADEVTGDLRTLAVGLFSNYDVAYRYGTQARKGARSAGRKREIAAELRQARKTTELALRAAIRRAYREQLVNGKLAAFNVRPPDKAERRFLERLRREEYVFVGRFLDDIERGRIKMPVVERAALYGNAAMEAYWFGLVYGDQSPDRYLGWQRSPAESCPDCLYLAGDMSQATLALGDLVNVNPDVAPGGRWGNGIYSAQELALLGVVPRSGKLRCTTRCQCELVPVLRPEAEPQGAIQRTPYRSLAPKYVQPQYEQRRRRHDTKRVRRDGTVVRKGLSGDAR